MTPDPGFQQDAFTDAFQGGGPDSIGSVVGPLTTSGQALGLPVVVGAAADQPDEVRARLKTLRARFIWAYTHPLWERWRKEAAEDLAFVRGDQWDPAARKKLEDAQRAVLTINEIRPVVEILTGYERTARLEPRPIPEGPEDLEDVTILGHLMKRVQHDDDTEFTLSEGFKEGIITGLGAWKVDIDYDEDPVHGRPTVARVPPGEFLFDPMSQRYDLADAREIFWHKMVALDELIAHYPEHADALEHAVEAEGRGEGVGLEIMPRELGGLPDYPGAGENLDAVQLLDAQAREVRVVEAWYRSWEESHAIADDRRGTVERVSDDDTEALEAARVIAAIDPSLRIITKRRRVWNMSLFVPAIGVELENDQPFVNDTQAHPFAAFVAYREGEHILGIVRNLKDPQREINKRRSALADNVSRFGNIKWFVYRNSLENPAALESGGGASDVYWLRSQASQPPKPVEPPPMPSWVWEMQSIAKLEIREISGINADLLGMKSDDSSGIAIARRQQQGQVIATPLFDNYKRSRRIIGRRLAKRIQQVYTGEQVVRLDEQAAGSKFVRINEKVIRNGRQIVLRDIPALNYDVVMAEAPSTPSARAQTLTALLELLQKVPTLGPILSDVVIELTDIPNREAVLTRVRQVMAREGVPMPGEPSAPPVAPPAGPLLTARTAPPPRSRQPTGLTQGNAAPGRFEAGASPAPRDYAAAPGGRPAA